MPAMSAAIAFIGFETRSGATPADAYYVKCDDELNSQEVRDAGRVVGRLDELDLRLADRQERDPDTIGFQNWVNTLNADPSNFRHMIFGFLFSTEYLQRFGP